MEIKPNESSFVMPKILVKFGYRLHTTGAQNAGGVG